VPRRLLHGLTVFSLALLGCCVGVAGSFVQAMDAYVGGVRVPWGVVLAIASIGALLLVARATAASRWAVGLAMFGWLCGVIPFTFQRPEGDLVISSGATGLVFLAAGVVIAGVGLGVSAPSAKSVESTTESDSIELPWAASPERK
jgi:Family of unknown function (DUF6113)